MGAGLLALLAPQPGTRARRPLAEPARSQVGVGPWPRAGWPAERRLVATRQTTLLARQGGLLHARAWRASGLPSGVLLDGQLPVFHDAEALRPARDGAVMRDDNQG
jgi:hypothetical protein